ncbi:hypothetical protein M8494_03215 [Serratia ureilytica]
MALSDIGVPALAYRRALGADLQAAAEDQLNGDGLDQERGGHARTAGR